MQSIKPVNPTNKNLHERKAYPSIFNLQEAMEYVNSHHVRLFGYHNHNQCTKSSCQICHSHNQCKYISLLSLATILVTGYIARLSLVRIRELPDHQWVFQPKSPAGLSKYKCTEAGINSCITVPRKVCGPLLKAHLGVKFVSKGPGR